MRLVLDKGTSLSYYTGMVSMQQQEDDIRSNKPQYIPWWELNKQNFADSHIKDNAHPAKEVAWDMLWESVQGRFMRKEMHERVAGAVDRVWRTWTYREKEYYADDQFNPYNLATAIFDGAGRFVDLWESDHHRTAEAVVFWTLFYKEFKNWAHHKGYPTSNEKFYNLAFEMHRKGQHDT